MIPVWLIWASDVLLTLAAATALAIGPQGLLTEVSGEQPTWRRALGLALPAAVAGFAALAACAALGRPLIAGQLAAAAVCLAAVLVVDGRWFVIPDVYVVALAILGLAGASQIGWAMAAIGAALGGGLLAGVRWAFLRFARIEGLGFGDVKLMAAVGLVVGPAGVLWVVIWASALGAIWILLRGRTAEGRRQMAPFGACAAVPAFLVLALGRLG
ncbi:MAG TPA: A24 family peptidase [Caulobacteraceae bacterium]|jgi:leader peptidase (prepilin peptidase)/N-methyltransferase|nr:A24 family peptidase [Caulobacteraceae bacterium]